MEERIKKPPEYFKGGGGGGGVKERIITNGNIFTQTFLRI